MDLNIIVEQFSENVDNFRDMVKKSFSLGFKCVALNTVISAEQLKEKGVKVPEPTEMSLEGKAYKHHKILSRITAVIDDTLQGHHFIKSPETKKYDIIAVQPIGEKMLQHVCSNMDVDIISLNFTEKLKFSLKRTYVGQAIEKGICFEILYSPCLRDQTARRATICNAQILVNVSKGRNIIISSGALKILELRGVEDVANLGMLFGFKNNQAKDAVRKSGEIVLKHSGTRKETGCGFVSVQELLKLSKKDKWLVEACRIPKAYDTGLKTIVPAKRVYDQDEVHKRVKLEK